MQIYDDCSASELLSSTQKQMVLKHLHQVSLQTPQLILNMIISDIFNENGEDYPGKLGEMIERLCAPLMCFQSNLEEINRYKSNIQHFIQTHSTEVIELFKTACLNSEGWSSNKIRAIAKQFQIQIQEIIRVRFIISKGKIFWEFRFGQQKRSKYPTLDGEYIEMNWDDFKIFKDSGKRQNTQKPDNYESFYAVVSGQQPVYRPNRNPKNGQHLTHANPGTCHICIFDVDTFSNQGLHMKSKGSHDLKKNPCPHCGEHFDFNRDHIPASSLLTKINARLTVSGLRGISRDDGIVIAVPTYLHSFISASYKHKAKSRDELEAEFPAAAIYKDINSYLRFFWDSPTEPVDLKKVGALRYLYRKNVKLLEDFSSQHIDHLFMSSVKRYLRRKDGGNKAKLLAYSSKPRNYSFFQNNQNRPYFTKLNDNLKNDITLAVILHDVKELEIYYQDPNNIRFIIKILSRDPFLSSWENFQALMLTKTQNGALPLIFEIVKMALDDENEFCLKIISDIIEQTGTSLDEIFDDEINGLTLFDICILYYNSVDQQEFLETIFSYESYHMFWTHQDNTGMTPVMKALRTDNSEAIKFTIRNRIKCFNSLDKDSTDISVYETLNCFYENYSDPIEGVDTTNLQDQSALQQAVSLNSEDCVKVILAAHPDVSKIACTDKTSKTIKKLIRLAQRVADIISTKGGEIDENLFTMLVIHDEGDLLIELCDHESALMSIEVETLENLFKELLPCFLTNETTDEIFKILTLLFENTLTTYRDDNKDTLIHSAVRKNRASKIALCASLLSFSPEDGYSFNNSIENLDDLKNEFHDEAIHIRTLESLTAASIIYYRQKYEESLEEFLSQTNQQNQSAIALAYELKNFDTVKLLLACGAKLEKCIYDDRNPELRMIARLINLTDVSEPDAIGFLDVIDGESTDTVFLFFDMLKDMYQNWPNLYENPLHIIFDAKFFSFSSDESSNSDVDDSDEDHLDLAESIQNFVNKLTIAQKTSVLKSIQIIEPLRDLLVELIQQSVKRTKTCSELLQLLINQPKIEQDNQLENLNSQMHNIGLGFG